MGLFDQFARLYSDVSKRRQEEKQKELQDVFNALKIQQAQNNLDLYPLQKQQMQTQNEYNTERLKQYKELYPIKKEQSQYNADITNYEKQIKEIDLRQKQAEEDIDKILNKMTKDNLGTTQFLNMLNQIRQVAGVYKDYIPITPTYKKFTDAYTRGDIDAKTFNEGMANSLSTMIEEAKQIYDTDATAREKLKLMGRAKMPEEITPQEALIDNINNARKIISPFKDKYDTLMKEQLRGSTTVTDDDLKKLKTEMIMQLHNAGFNEVIISNATGIPYNEVKRTLEYYTTMQQPQEQSTSQTQQFEQQNVQQTPANQVLLRDSGGRTFTPLRPEDLNSL